MNIQIFSAFQANAQESGVLFFYSGEFTPAVVNTAAEMLKHRMSEQDASSAAKRKLFSTFVEMAQNILHYALPESSDPAPVKHGSIAVGRDEEAGQNPHFWIMCSNRVDSAHVPRITEKLEAVRSMSLEEIKRSYREQLHNTQHESSDAISKGAGLGLLTIARDSSAPLEYGFSSSVGEDLSTTVFHVRARI